MATSVITLEGVERVLRALGPALYRPAVAELIRSATLLAQRTARSEAPRDQSELSRSLMADIQPTMGRVYSTLAYARPMEEGRPPGRRMPPPDALRGWLQRHGMGHVPPFVVARAIARRGIKGRFFMRAAKHAVEQALPGLAARAAADIRSRWRA